MDKIEEVLTRGVAEVLPDKECLAKLMSERKITLYQGFDPTGAQLHIGHAVGLRKLAKFQELGHKVIFLIGDFTGMIGDPSGKLSSRKVLTREQVLENAKTYKEQAGRILKFSGDNPVEIKFNSEWLTT
jgi:tyrosyl-tRNA synthetase